MKNTKWLLMSVVTLMMIAGLFQSAAAQTLSATGTVQIQAVKNETLTINAIGLATPFDISTGNSTSQNMTITTQWNLKPSRASVGVCTYMDATTGALQGTGNNTDTIDPAYVQAKPASAGSFAAINATPACGVATGVTTVNTYTLQNHADRTGVTKTDSVAIQLSSVPTTIQADTYTGTITVVAYVQ
jgi:hypothetical protein